MRILFGSFLAGTIMPKDSEFVRYLLGKFSMMVLMALVTTFLTSSLLEWVCPQSGGGMSPERPLAADWAPVQGEPQSQQNPR